MKKPIILLTGHWEPKSPSFSAPFLGLYFHYFEAVTRAGGMPVMVPYHADLSDFVELGDGLLFTGGYDVDPALYHDEPRYYNVEVTKERDDNEAELYALWRKTGKPIFGICRGLQFLNVMLGGTLIQDIPVERSVMHNRHVHTVKVNSGFRMSDWFGASEVVTNSFHHQGANALGEGLVVTATTDDGIIEGIEHQELPYFAVQYHPERMIGNWRPQEQSDMSKLFKSFVDLCR